jgi:hypothetical protein
VLNNIDPFKPFTFRTAGVTPIGSERIERGMKKEMNKRYLAAIAALFIVTMVSSSLIPVYSQNTTTLRATAMPTLSVVTIAEDDEMAKTGIMLLGMPPTTGPYAAQYSAYQYSAQDLMSQFKVLVSYNGVPVTAALACQVIEKDKVNPLKTKQGAWENLASAPKDMTSNFICKYRESKPGVGVIDVYFVGPAATSSVIDVGQFIADYILVVAFAYTVGRTVVYGTEIQDICVLGWSFDSAFKVVTKPDGTEHYVFTDPLTGFTSCEDAALVQKDMLGIPIAWV